MSERKTMGTGKSGIRAPWLALLLVAALAAPAGAEVLSYTNTVDGSGNAVDLTSVTVDHGPTGWTLTYPVEQLIGITLTHFKANASSTNIAAVPGTGAPATGSRAALLDGDNRLSTGLINPGRAAAALTTDPVIDHAVPANSTPGFAIVFDRPVLNGPGDDVVFFELHNAAPDAGDSFHVSPLSGIGSGLHSTTITAYDIDRTHAAVKTLAPFALYSISGGSYAQSLGELETKTLSGGGSGSGFQALAVGIDLSDMGYAPGAAVGGLFFQDNSGDAYGSSVVDPIFIAGLPNPVQALSVTTADGRGADAYIRGQTQYRDNNFGGDDRLATKNSAAGNHRKAYLRFDIDADLCASVLTAQLTLATRDDPWGANDDPNKVWTFNVFGLNDSASGDGDPDSSGSPGWWEGTGVSGLVGQDVPGIDWLNAPANDNTGDGFTSAATLLGTFAITGDSIAGQTIDFSSTALIDFLNSDTNGLVTLMIARDTLGDDPSTDTVIHFFASKEYQGGAYAPTLDITYVPEPATLALLGGGIGLAALRRRRRT